MGALYWILGTIIGLILISFFFNFNIGPLAVLTALIMGKVLLGMSTGKVLALLPDSTLMTMIVLSGFYGFAIENGTARILIHRLLKRFGEKAAFLPVLIFLMTMVMSGVGLGSGNATMIMAPIALGIVAEMGVSPLIMAMAVSCGAAAGSNFPFSFGGSIAISLIEGDGYLADGGVPVMEAALHNLMIQVLSFGIVYLWKKGYKNNGIVLKEIPSMTAVQKKNCVLILITVSCSIVPAVMNILMPGTWWETVSSYLDMNTVMLAGIIAAMILRLADEKEVVKKHIPWLLLVVIGGMSMLIGIAREYGIVDWLGNVLSMNLSSSLIPYAVILIGMGMSLFGGAISIVVPTLFPMVPGIAAGAGLDMGHIFGCVLNGATCGGISPYSSGGMILLGSYPSQERRKEFLKELMVMPFYQVLITMFIYYIWK